MSAKKMRGLGRGFESLIPTQYLDEEFDPTQEQDEKLSELRDINIEDITPNTHQPRDDFDEEALNDLAGSIKMHGVLQPIVVIAKGGKYELVAGERRWRASRLAGKETIPALVRSYSDQQKLELALIENLQREDLNALETATACYKLGQQFNLTTEEIGKRIGRATSTVSNIIRLLGLPIEAKRALVKGDITEGHARQILAIHEPEVQKELMELIIKNGWTVRKAEQFVIGYKEGKKSRQTAAVKVLSETPQTQKLTRRLGANVSVKHMAKGGQLIIRFQSDDDLDRIADLLLR